MEITTEQIAEWKRLAAEATPGKATEEFYHASRTAVPALIAEVEALKKAIENLHLHACGIIGERLDEELLPVNTYIVQARNEPESEAINAKNT